MKKRIYIVHVVNEHGKEKVKMFATTSRKMFKDIAKKCNTATRYYTSSIDDAVNVIGQWCLELQSR